MGSRASKFAESPVPGDSRLRLYAGYAVLALACALADLRVIILMMPKVLLRSAEVIEGVVDREPLWRVYQNRLLGPHLVRALSTVTAGGPAVAYALVMLLVLFLAGLSVLIFTWRLRDPQRTPLASLLLYQLCVILLLPCYWLYVWDILSLLLFTVFVGLVLLRPGRVWFVLLYAIAVFNHEMAFFIAGWLILDPLVRHLAGRHAPGQRPRFDRASLLTGSALLVAGIALVEGLRQALMIREMQPGLEVPPQVVYGKNFHFTLLNNLTAIGNCFDQVMQNGFPVVVPLFLAFTVFVAVRLARMDLARFGALALVLLGMVGSLMLFGLVYETRVLLPLVPFVALNGWAAICGRTPAGADHGAAGHRGGPPGQPADEGSIGDLGRSGAGEQTDDEDGGKHISHGGSVLRQGRR